MIKLRTGDLTRFAKMLASAPLDMLAPRVCLICGSISDSADSSYLCVKCVDALPVAPPKEEIYRRFIRNFPAGKLCVSAATALLSFSEDKPYRNLIYGLKYGGFKRIGSDMGRLLARRLKSDEMTDYDYITPLPIHRAKRRERGYNQSDFIASELAACLGLKFNNKLVIRNVYTKTQTALDAGGRAKNVEAIFIPGDEKSLKDKRVLLIDDVLTTGASLNSCAEALLIGGAGSVDAATVAVA